MRLRSTLAMFSFLSALFLMQSIFASFCEFDMGNELNDDCSFLMSNNSEKYNTRCTIVFDKSTTTVDPNTFSLHKGIPPLQVAISTGGGAVNPLAIHCKYYSSKGNTFIGTCSLSEIEIRDYGIVPVLVPKCTSPDISMSISTSNISRDDIVTSQIIFNLDGSAK